MEVTRDELLMLGFPFDFKPSIQEVEKRAKLLSEALKGNMYFETLVGRIDNLISKLKRPVQSQIINVDEYVRETESMSISSEETGDENKMRDDENPDDDEETGDEKKMRDDEKPGDDEETGDGEETGDDEETGNKKRLSSGTINTQPQKKIKFRF